MAKYIAATQYIAVRVRLSAAPTSKGKKERNKEKNETHEKKSVRNRWDRRQHRAADLPIHSMFAAPTPRFATSITRTHAPVSLDLT
jgi:hypothetical protein